MASILSHTAVPVALSLALGRKRISARLLFIMVTLSILPDIDVVGFLFGVPYSSPLGHRGFTHSLAFAFALAGLLSPFFSAPLSPLSFFLIAFTAISSHAFLDAMTNGGLGVAFFWPFSNERFFLPWKFIEVSPIGISRFFSDWGFKVIVSELMYIWPPCLMIGLLGLILRSRRADT